jgi:hypothetical protein
LWVSRRANACVSKSLAIWITVTTKMTCRQKKRQGKGSLVA